MAAQGDAAVTVNHRLPIHPAYRPPATRGECIEGTANTGSLEERRAGKVQCSAYRCRYNLLWVESDQVPGRRHGGLAPEGTLSGANTNASAPSCALDLVDANPAGMSSAEIANAVGLDRRRVEQIVKRWQQSEAAVELARLRRGE